MTIKDESFNEQVELQATVLKGFNTLLTLNTGKEIHRLTSLLAVADFYTGGSRELLHDILWGEKYSHVSMEVKAAIANANRHHRDDAIVWSYRYLEGEALKLFIKTCELEVDMVPLVVDNEHVTGAALNEFLDGYSSPETKIAYLEQLSIVNFTDEFIIEVWHRVSRRNYDNKINPILIAKFRTVWGLDAEVPDTWVIHVLNQIASKH